ncbi:MAG TPA: alanine--tRNA ligase, partial [Myxococcales bacterium]|nr:alanine--tRNA ligase [Myxococcales bacterium]
RVERVTTGQQAQVLLDRTPFYGEGGGQVGDRGLLRWNDLSTDADVAEVIDTTKPAPNVFLHQVEVRGGSLDVGDVVYAQVSTEHRAGVSAHHSATHLLHKALRDVLGGHVKQRGSLVEVDRLRFDFSHFEALNSQDLSEIEKQVNEVVLANVATDIRVTSMDEAKELGALMFFGDKYGDEVRVVTLDDSIELCGGIHVKRTGEIGLIKVVSESGISAGVRRVEAQCHLAALDQVQQNWGQLEGVTRRLNVKMTGIDERVAAMLDQIKKLERELTKTRQDLALAQAGGGGGDSARREQIGDFAISATVVDGIGGKDLRVLGDQARDKLGKGAALVVGTQGDKVGVLVAVTKAESALLHAGKLVGQLAPLVGGRGGGRPDFAQAGGSDAAGVEALVERFFEVAQQAFEAQ